MPCIAIIPGHGNRYRGGRFVYDPGAVSGDVRETEWVRRLCSRVVDVAPPGMVQVFDEPQKGGPLSTYTQRRKAAMRWIGAGPAIVMHMHCNAGGGRYSLAMHDPRSSAGAAHADALTEALTRDAPALTGAAPCRVMAASRPDWRHAANLIEPTYLEPRGISALLFEWAFVDMPGAAHLYGSSLDETAHAIASLI